MKSYVLIVIVITGILGYNKSQAKDLQSKPNVLFIAVDDLRPELGCYGQNQVISPNIDRLASEGIVFNRAYCNIPVCGASRSSLLTGLYPTRNRFTTYYTRVDEDAPEVTTLPQCFKENGYKTLSFGKVFHHLDDGLDSWSETPWRPDYPNNIHLQENWRDYQKKSNTSDGASSNDYIPAWENANVSDDAYYDGKTANKAISTIEELAKSDNPFFLAVGFLKPHLPFNAPAKYWNLYDRNELTPASNPFFPKDAPKESRYNYGELRSYSNIPNGDTLVSEETARWLKHGYYACVSYTDALIGRVLQALKETGLDKNTIVVLWGDHGWSLGEHTHWCKHTCFYNSLQSPLIIKSPELNPSNSEMLVSYVDLFPTLCDLTQIKKPEHLEGHSIFMEINNPDTNSEVEFCRYPNGETIVTERYVYTEYYNKKGDTFLSSMLYDHQHDPEENVNVVTNPKYKTVVKELREKLRAHIEKVNAGK